jgi:LacI family transcriptional regulator, galactose operon repressor
VPVSIREVAAHAGVSVATVSNGLNRPEIVAQRTRDRVNASIRQLGFVRNKSARQLRAGHSRTIGLVVLDVANPLFTDVARGVEDEASKAGLAVILCNSYDQERKEKRTGCRACSSRRWPVPGRGWPGCSGGAPPWCSWVRLHVPGAPRGP